jgi:AraC family transcriptional regulator, arabinose operon regulatory protein
MRYVETNPGPAPFQMLHARLDDGRWYAFRLFHMNLADRKVRDPFHPHKEHRHDVYHVALYRGGSGLFLLDGTPTPCRKGSLVLTSPGQPHDFGPEGDGELEFAELSFSFVDVSGGCLKISFAELLSLLFGQRIAIPVSPLNLPDWRAKQLFGLLTSCYEALSKRNVDGEANVAAAFMKVFLFLLELLLPAGSPGSGKEQYLRLLKAKDFIEKDFDKKLELGELARLCGMEASHFCRSFKRQFGCSPIEFALRRRVEAAKALLSTTGLPCKEIAALVGFNDPVYFNRLFKSRCGKPPMSFRRGAE